MSHSYDKSDEKKEVWYNQKCNFIWLRYEDEEGVSFGVPLEHDGKISVKAAKNPGQYFNVYLGEL